VRKLSDAGDPLNEVLGSTGITGTVDTVMVMKKERRFSGDATLYVSGRDVEQQELRCGLKTKFGSSSKAVTRRRLDSVRHRILSTGLFALWSRGGNGAAQLRLSCMRWTSPTFSPTLPASI
jgi:hypothetical protein